MENWYLKDSRGAHVGPISRQVAVDLIRAKPGVFLFVSGDAKEWKPIARSAPVQEMVQAERAPARAARENDEAKRLQVDLERLRRLQPHELFGVPRNASLREFRMGFASVAKHVNPGRLPQNVSPFLLRSHMATYQYFTEVLHEVERGFERAAPISTTTQWNLARLQLKQTGDRLQASLEVNSATVQVFCIDRLMNLQNASVFFPCLPTLALGTRLRLTFQFVEAGRDIEALGAVAFEALDVDPRRALKGFGVKLDGINAESKQFMRAEVQRLTELR